MMEEFNAVTMAHKEASRCIVPGDLCIDATAGRGNDTAFLCERVGVEGRVLAFDIQSEALASAKELLERRGLLERAELIRDSHANMASYARPESVSCILFNFGWLPGGDHSVFTRPESSIPAIAAGLELLRPGGVMCLCVYYGRDSGFRERDELLSYLNTVDSKRFTVIVSSFANRPNNPPIPAMIYKHSTG